jgi:hypothetical protein
LALINNGQDKTKRKKLDTSGIFQNDLNTTVTQLDTTQSTQQKPVSTKLDISGIFQDESFTGDFDSLKVAPQQEKEESKGIFQQLKEAFTGENLETEDTKKLAELGTKIRSPEVAKITSTAQFSATTPQEIANIITSNEGFEQRTDKKGNLIIIYPDKSEELVNAPGFSSADAFNIFNEAAQFFPAVKYAGMAKKFISKLARGAIGSGLTSTAKEGIQSQIGGEFDPSNIAVETAFGAVGEAIPAGIKALRQSRQAKLLGAEKDAIAETTETIAKADEATKATGVELFPAQKTQVPATLEKQSFIATLPTAQRASISALKKQNKQAGEAVENFLNDIAKSDVIETGAEKFRTASQKAIEAQKTIRKEKTSTLFNEAFADDTIADLTPVRELIENKLKDFPSGGEVENSLNKIIKLIDGEPSLRKLQNAKLEIDQMVAKFGEGSLGNTTKREVLEIKNALLNQMDEASPIYKQARELFAKESPAVEQLEKSLIGKIAKVDDEQLKTISKKIFDPEQTNVGSVLKTKKIIENVDPEAWNGLLRVELERRLGGIRSGLRETAGETVENIPAQLNRAIFGNQKQTNILLNSVSKEQAKNLRYIQTVLKKAGSGRLGGSQTATREEIKKELKGGVLNFFGNLFTPLETLKGGLSGATFDKNVKKMAEALFNTKWQPQLSKIRKINPNTPEAARLWTQLLNDIENENEVK